MAFTRKEISDRYKQRHPERFTAEARRARRNGTDVAYRKTQAYQDARAKYIASGKKKLADHNGHLKHRYGKTLQDKINQFEKQSGICTLCNEFLPEDISKCHWDHNHQTGKMRDLLHKYCNQLLGWVECKLHKQALEYLDKHSEDK